PEIQTALGQASLQALPGLGVLGAAYGMPLGVEQYAVAAPKGGQRADQVQTLGGALQLLAVLRQAQLHGPRQTLAHLLQSFLQQTQQPLGMLLLQSSMQAGQLLAAQIHALLPDAAQAQFQLIQALALLGQPLPRVPQATAQGVQSQPLPLQADLHALLQLAMTALQLLQHGPGVGAEQFGGRRGGGGAYVGNEVADGYIGLVPDGTDHRGAAGGHGPGDHFLGERPEVLQPATVPGLSARSSACTICRAASRTWTAVVLITCSTTGARRPYMLMMSGSAAPLDEVMTPIRVGCEGGGLLRSAANRPSACSRALSASKAWRSAPSPAGSTASRIIW